MSFSKCHKPVKSQKYSLQTQPKIQSTVLTLHLSSSSKHGNFRTVESMLLTREVQKDLKTGTARKPRAGLEHRLNAAGKTVYQTSLKLLVRFRWKHFNLDKYEMVVEDVTMKENKLRGG